MKNCILGLVMLLGYLSYSQGLVCLPEDKLAFENKISTLETQQAQNPGERLVGIGKSFIGTPYVAGTLEVAESESLVINLRGLDCTTFVENVLALAIIYDKRDPTFDAFTDVLQNIRYRNGVLSGYASRLHYFSEWITDNEKKGWVKEVTQYLGGVPMEKTRDFMTSHRELYPHLKSQENYAAMARIEKGLKSQPVYFLPSSAIAKQEQLIRNGDIIALATSIDGLDVTHTGIASREKDGRIYLLHASSKGQVELSNIPLTDYLAGVKNNIGILIARPTF